MDRIYDLGFIWVHALCELHGMIYWDSTEWNIYVFATISSCTSGHRVVEDPSYEVTKRVCEVSRAIHTNDVMYSFGLD